MRRRWTLAVGVMTLVLLSGGCAKEQPWNVLVVTFDTTRADFLGCYGKTSARTPHLDSLAADGYLFRNALASIPITLPSHSTLFTGTYPLVHGVRDNGLFRLPDQSETLAEILRAQGYATGAAIGGFPLTREFGIDQGFEFFDDKIQPSTDELDGLPLAGAANLFFDERSASKVNDAILPWLRENIDRPFFTWIHYWDPHHPHIPPAPFDQLYRHDLYQGEIAYADQNLGVILDELKASGVYDRTLIVMTSDHGEGRGEHQEDTHSLLTYDSTLNVPLIIKVPGRDGGDEVEGRVGTVQVLATVLELLGLETPEIVQGRSLVSHMDAESVDESTPLPEERAIFYAETLSPRLSHGWGEIRTLYDGSLKYIYGPRPELYDVEQDPQELRDLSAERPEDRERMERQLATFIRREASDLAASAAHEADDEALNRLAALGYISGGGDTSGSVTEVLRDDGIPPQDRVADNSMSSRMKQAIDRGDHLEARDYGLRLIQKDPQNAYYRRLLVVAYLGLGQIAEAADIVDNTNDITPQNHLIFMQVATEIFANGGHQRGIDLGRRIAETQKHALSYYVLAEMYATLRHAAKYKEYLQASLELDPSFPRSRLSLGILEAQLGNTEAARELLSTLVDDFPFEPRYHFNLAVFLIDHGRGDEALGHLRRAQEIAPKYWPAQLALLTLQIQRGLADEARATYRFIDDNCLHAPSRERAEKLIETL